MENVFKIVNWFRFEDVTRGNGNLTQMKIMKLLYYVQGYYLSIYGKRAFSDDLVAWKYGPVVQSVHNKFIGQREIVDDKAASSYENDYFDINKNKKLVKILNAVNKQYGNYTAAQLVRKTHLEAPYTETEMNDIICDEKMKQFFKDKPVYLMVKSGVSPKKETMIQNSIDNHIKALDKLYESDK